MSDELPGAMAGDDCTVPTWKDGETGRPRAVAAADGGSRAPYRHFLADEVQSAIAPRLLAERLLAVFRTRPESPLRQRIPVAGGGELMVMPAVLDSFAGVKTLTIVPGNAGTARPVISGLFTLFDLATGDPIATFDCSALTAVRTAAISAAASKRLSRPDSRQLCVLGAGHLAPYLASAHADVRPVERVTFWARRRDQARTAAQFLRTLRPDLDVIVDESLERAVRSADIVTAATRATDPLIRGDWLREGQHLDLVGGYRPDMRELDDAGVARSEIFVDSLAAALSEAGDIMGPLGASAIGPDSILGELADLAVGSAGRSAMQAITLFKSVGTGVADLAAAVAIWEARRDAAAGA